MFNAQQYIEQRKKLLEEERELMYQRNSITKLLRKVQHEMISWDRCLINIEGGVRDGKRKR